MAQVKQVAVTAVNRLERARHRDVELLGIGERILTRADVPLAPGRDRLELGVQRHHRHFKAHLIVAFAGAAVRDGVRAFHLGDLHQMLGDQRARKRRAEQILALVNRPGLHRRVDEIGQKFLAQIADVELARSRFERLFFQPGRVLLPAPDQR